MFKFLKKISLASNQKRGFKYKILAKDRLTTPLPHIQKESHQMESFIKSRYQNKQEQGSNLDSLPEQSVTCKLFVGGLPVETRNKDIFKAFRGYGELSFVNLFRDHRSGLCKGFGDFVITISSEEALVHLLKQEFHIKGQKVHLERFLGGENLKEKTKKHSKKKVFVKNIPRGMTDAELFGIFSQFGKVQNAYQFQAAPRSYQTFGVVTFSKDKAVELCLRQQRVVLRDAVIHCCSYQERNCDGNKIHGTASNRLGNQGRNIPGANPESEEGYQFERRAAIPNLNQDLHGSKIGQREQTPIRRRNDQIPSGEREFISVHDLNPGAQSNTGRLFQRNYATQRGNFENILNPRSPSTHRWFNKRSWLMQEIMREFNKRPGDSDYDYLGVNRMHQAENVRLNKP